MDDLLEFGKVTAVTRHGDSFGGYRDPVFDNCTCHPDDPFDPTCPPYDELEEPEA